MAEKTAEEGVTRQGTQTRGWDLASQEGTSPVPEQDAEPGGMPPGPRPRGPRPRGLPLSDSTSDGGSAQHKQSLNRNVTEEIIAISNDNTQF